jgi:hypothetical protein
MPRVRTTAVERARTTCESGIHLDDRRAGGDILRLMMILLTALLIRVFVAQRQGVVRPGRRLSLPPPSPRGAGGGVGVADAAAPGAGIHRRRPTGDEIWRLVGVYGAIVGICAPVVLVPDAISVVTMVDNGTIPPPPSRPRPPSQIPPEPPEPPELVQYPQVAEEAADVARDQPHGLDERREEGQEDPDDEGESSRQVGGDEGGYVDYALPYVLLLQYCRRGDAEIGAAAAAAARGGGSGNAGAGGAGGVGGRGGVIGNPGIAIRGGVLPGVRHEVSDGGACLAGPRGGVPRAPPRPWTMRSPPRRRPGWVPVAARVAIDAIFLASLQIQVDHRGRVAPGPARSDPAAATRRGPAARGVHGRLGGVAPVLGRAVARSRGVAVAVVRGVGVEPALLAAAAAPPRRRGPGRRRPAGRDVVVPPAAARRQGRGRPSPLDVIGERYFPGG